MQTPVPSPTRRTALALGVAVAAAALCLAAPRLAHAAHWHLPLHLRRWLRRDRWIELREHGHRPVPSPADKRDGFILFSRSPLERIYPDSRPRPEDLVRELHVQAARDEYEPVQLGVQAVRDLQAVSVSVSDLRDDAGDVLPASAAVVRMVRFYGAALSARHRDRFGVVPKTLELAAPIGVRRGSIRPYWITVHAPPEQPGGVYRGAVRVAHERGAREVPIAVEVIPIRLAEPDVLYGTLSINPLAKISHALAHRRRLLFAPTIEEEIELSGARPLLESAEVMLRDQRAHGMNTISPWSAKEYALRDGHPYLSDVEVAMVLYRRLGFTKPMLYQMGTLLHTNKINRAATYRQFDPARDGAVARAVAAHYTAEFARQGLPGIIFLPVEEPNLGDGVSMRDAPDARQNIARELLREIKEAGGRTALNCTPESAAAVGGLVDYWIVAHRRFTADVYDAAKRAGANVGLYANTAMMGQGTYLPRFLFGYFVWANGLKAMLPWTYPVQPNRFPDNVGKRGEGALNVHDGFLGPDGTPVPTIQWELSREGIDDAKYMTTLEQLAAEAAGSANPAAREAVDSARAFLAEVRAMVSPDAQHYAFENRHTFEPQAEDGWDAARFEQTRARAGALIRQLLAAR